MNRGFGDLANLVRGGDSDEKRVLNSWTKRYSLPKTRINIRSQTERKIEGVGEQSLISIESSRVSCR